MSEHTPTPWTIHSAHGLCIARDERIICDFAPRADDLCPRPGGYEQYANALFIVRACNCHDELLAVCRALITAIDDHQIWRPSVLAELRHHASEAVDKATATD